MLFARKRVSARQGVVLLAAVGLSISGATLLGGTAAADPVAATYQGVEHNTTSLIDLVETGDGHGGEAGTGIIDLQSGGKTLRTYCINLAQQIASGNPKYQEQDWDAWQWENGTAPAHINWILHHSYPALTVDQVITAAGATSNGDHGKDLKDVVAGTQAAIWHYSDGVQLAGPDELNDALVIAVYKYLTGSANTGEQEPGPSLSLSPMSLSVADDNKPADTSITVTTSAAAVDLKYTAPSGVTLTDNGETAGTTAKNGDKLNLKVAPGTAPGNLALSVTATGQVPVGRIFKGTERGTQTLILAGSAPVSLTASATLSWSHTALPAPSVTFTEDCSSKSVVVKLSNSGDSPAVFTVGGKTYTVAPGSESTTVKVPVPTSGDYDVSVTSGTKTWESKGHLNCQVVGPPASGPSSPGNASAPAVAPADNNTSPPLASTGSSSVPMLAGIGGGVIVLGAALFFFLRGRGRTAAAGGDGNKA